MFPWLRMFKVGMRFQNAPRVGLLDTTTIRLRVWPNDLDVNLHVNNGRYLTLADLGRIDWFVRAGVFQVARQRGIFPVVGDAIAKFRRELKPWQLFEIHTRMLGWDDRWGFLEHRFVVNDRAVGVVAIRGVFRSAQGSVRPAELMEGVGATMASPPLPQWIQEWNAGCESLTQSLRAEEAERGIR